METQGEAHLAPPDLEAIAGRIAAPLDTSERERLAAGVARVAERWTDADGDRSTFESFCAEYFVVGEDDRRRLLDRFEILLTSVHGHLYEIARTRRRWVDLQGESVAGFDDLVATFDPAPDLSEEWYRQRVAFIALLNFERPSLRTMLDSGSEWSGDEWAAARVGQAFGPRIPRELGDRGRAIDHRANRFVDGFHVPVGGVVDADGRRPFEADKRLVAHWLIREAIVSRYGDPDGLPAQRAIAWVMRRHVDGTIPAALMEGGTRGKTRGESGGDSRNDSASDPPPWDPAANTLDGRAISVDQTIGPGRYAIMLDHFELARAYDRHYPMYPTALARTFELHREIETDTVEAVLIELLEAPVRRDLATAMVQRLGRPLESHDVYFHDLAGRPSSDDLDARVAERFPTVESVQAQLPDILRTIGFEPELADFLGSRVQVELARGAGHAVPPGMPEYGAWLRTNGRPGGLDWDGFEIGMHELGHNIEQLCSVHFVPRPMLQRVPNSACSEAFAFLFQSQARRIAGLADEAGVEAAGREATLRTMLDACQISGPALVELRAWRWMYSQPSTPTPEALRDTVLHLADEVWRTYYADHFGPDPYALLGAYQHMVGYPLYLSNYVLGHVMSEQVRAHVMERDLASETVRICGIGSLTPEAWLEQAVGTGLRPDALIDGAAAALAASHPPGVART